MPACASPSASPSLITSQFQSLVVSETVFMSVKILEKRKYLILYTINNTIKKSIKTFHKEFHKETLKSKRTLRDLLGWKSTYLITVKYKESIDLIQSPKKNLSSIKSDKKIVKGKTYKFNLSKSSLTSRNLGINNNVYIDDKKVWSTDSDFNLVEAKDLNGLNIVTSYRCKCNK